MGLLSAPPNVSQRTVDNAYEWMAARANEHQLVKAPIRQLGRGIGISRTGAHAAIAQLILDGRISVVMFERAKPTLYRLEEE